jgi:hypothetical protein
MHIFPPSPIPSDSIVVFQCHADTWPIYPPSLVLTFANTYLATHHLSIYDRLISLLMIRSILFRV